MGSDLLWTEAVRAVRRLGDGGALERTRSLLDRVGLVKITSDVFRTAGRIGPPVLRSLDALHIAAALALGEELAGLVSYDARLLAAAADVGVATASPGAT